MEYVVTPKNNCQLKRSFEGQDRHYRKYRSESNMTKTDIIGFIKEYLKFVNRLYDITWFVAVYAK